MSTKTIFIIFSLIANLASESPAQEDFFDRSEEFFSTYVENGAVKYSILYEDAILLDALVYDIAHIGLSGRSREYKGAFFINAYNILVIKNIVNHWKIGSPLEVEGFFDEIKFNIAQEYMTLNDIENIKLRKDLGDPRIHFAIVCGGKGCPPIRQEVILPGNLKNRLNDLTVAALNSPRMVKVDQANKMVYLSKIFEWYQPDFGGGPLKVVRYINRYSSQPVAESYTIEYMEYDWSLNGQ